MQKYRYREFFVLHFMNSLKVYKNQELLSKLYTSTLYSVNPFSIANMMVINASTIVH